MHSRAGLSANGPRLSEKEGRKQNSRGLHGMGAVRETVNAPAQFHRLAGLPFEAANALRKEGFP
jgi:hypothetical protein